MILRKEKKSIFIGSNLNYLLAQHSLDIKNLSSETGVPAATIARLRKKGSNPTLSSIEPLLDFFRVDFDSFLYEDMSTQNYQNKKKMGDLVHISVFLLEEILDKKNNAKISHFIGAAGITGKNVYGISINSDALSPAFQANSIIIIDPDLKPVESDYVLCCLGDGEVDVPVFRQLFIDGSSYYFKPINPGFGEMKHYDNYKILGVIIKSIESYR